MSAAVCTPDLTREIEALRPYLMRFARAKLQDVHTAEDVVQDTLLAALAGKTPFLGQSGLRTWLTSILNYKIIDTYRKNAQENTRRVTRHPRQVESSHQDSSHHDDELQSPAEQQDVRQGLADPSQEIERRQMADRVMAAVQQLPAKQRDVFVLVQMHGYSGDEAAKAVGLSHSNVWVILHRARKMLQVQLRGVYQ